MKSLALTAVNNNPSLAGGFASEKLFFGEHKRYAVYAVHTRFDAVSWFVADAETPDEFGLASLVRQEPSLELAVDGL